MSKSFYIRIIIQSIAILLIFQACAVVKNVDTMAITIEANHNIIEGVEYSLTISNTRNNGDYIFNGHGLNVVSESNSTLLIHSLPDSTHFLEVYKIFKSDTVLIHKENFNVIPMPKPIIRWGQFENQNGAIEITKKEVLNQEQLYIDSAWQKSTNLKYEIVAVELKSAHVNSYISFPSGKIPLGVLKSISEYSEQNEIKMAVKIKCPDKNTRIYQFDKTIIVKN